MKTMKTIVLIGLLFTSTQLMAQSVTCSGLADDAFPCSYQIEEVALQRTPAVFKLQARVAQSKLPDGEGEFSAVVVKILRGQDVLCTETHAKVKVRESVLNLRIGEHMSCELDEIIAENQDLAFQVCLGGSASCLEPIELAAIPRAIKATYARTAETSDKANTSAQANYAHRLTADEDLFIRNALGTGYLDLHTPTPARVDAFFEDIGYDCPAADACAAGGFLQWTPIRDADALHLHVAGKQDAGDQMTSLETLVQASGETFATGNTTTQGQATVEQGLFVTDQGAHVVGASDITGTLVVSEATTIEGGGLTVEVGGAHVTGDSGVTGTLTVSNATTVQAGGLTVAAGGAQISSDVAVSGALGVSGVVTAGQGLSVSSGGAEITGDLMSNDDHRFEGALMISNDAHQLRNDDDELVLDIHGQVRFHDAVEFAGGTTDPQTPYAKKHNETDPVNLSGGLTVTGPLDLGVIARSCTGDAAATLYGCLCEPGEYPISGMAECPSFWEDPGEIFKSATFSRQEGDTIRMGWAVQCLVPEMGLQSALSITVQCLPFSSTPQTGETVEWRPLQY